MPILETMMIDEKDRFQILQKRFQTEILDKIIKTNHLNAKFIGNPDTRDYTSLSLCSCNRHYFESDYYLKDENQFIHFCSAKKMYSIINSGQIRLYNLSHQNDKDEFKFAAQLLGESPLACEKIRRRIYSLSMCRSETEADLTLWRLYGDDTKGVGLKLKIVNNPFYWMQYHLSQIYYGNIEKLLTYKSRKDEFEKTNKFRFIIGLERFLGFHKSEHYSVEKEVRLIYVHKNRENPFSFLTKTIDPNTLPEYISINLFNNYIYNEGQISDICHMDKPIIEIEEIVLGPNFRENNLIDFVKSKYTNIKIRKSSIGEIYKSK